MQARVREALRQWLAADDDTLLALLGRLGRDEIAHAAEQSRRLPQSTTPAAAEADAILTRLRTEVEALATPPAPPAQSFADRLFGRTSPPAPVAESGALLTGLLADLERQRDAVLREAITLRGHRERLVSADHRLEEAGQFLRLAEQAVEAAAREIAVDNPPRADLLRTRAGAVVQERLRDVLTQLLVTRQGWMTLDILLDGHQTLGAAIQRAGQTMMAALRTALSARAALAAGQRMTAQASALDRTAQAAAGSDHAGAARALDDAVEQMRHALAAATTGFAGAR
ncbi:toxic anion resistance protein [Sphingomonas sp.]|uniref:toxic anion resistance protein n=1 Tax=Sphingomonas sp. TaxID=28214 RepID=UPI0035AFC6D2